MHAWSMEEWVMQVDEQDQVSRVPLSVQADRCQDAPEDDIEFVNTAQCMFVLIDVCLQAVE